MSRSASIDFGFAAPVDVAAVIHGLAVHGMSFEADGVVSYLIDHDRMFDWQRVDASVYSEVVRQLTAERIGTALLGITVYLDDMPRGGDLLFFPDRSALSFNIEVNRKPMEGGSRFCDFGWYLQRLVPVMEPLGLISLKADDLPG
ncbi:hypothetical protein [Yinghuangia sp. YIM S10712]|uniref:hypothetical protein n=1 Tax=Yinghuangia sp. YIM S10712 TaxID=3436930 RepID=UPI003F52BBAE